MQKKFIIHGTPVGKARPRASVINGFARVHNTEENQRYESYVIDCYLDQIGEIRFIGEIKLQINVFYVIEKKHYIKRGLNQVGIDKKFGAIRPTKKPDIDNIAKIVMDALNGVAYRDDTQIVSLVVNKYYTDELPYLTVILEGDIDDKKS